MKRQTNSLTNWCRKDCELLIRLHAVTITRLILSIVLKSWMASRKHAYIILTPLKPHFYIVKLGFTRVYIIFLISAQKHRSMFWAEIWKRSEVLIEIFSFFVLVVKFSIYLNRRVFVMEREELWISCTSHNAFYTPTYCITKTRLFKYTENFTTKNGNFSDKKFWYFSYFCSKHRLCVLVRTASTRRF